ncbi:DUF1367 family protein [uncultured Paraglaciecola sp.]|uniref:DUF1367 family protein n=1 Tax=uncultured Paraglaciecola sp. TaxID=1765024 RepID=UPI00260ABFEC|nr:DUF1367 family protein [uncultured Paraglaciecola sp.]
MSKDIIMQKRSDGSLVPTDTMGQDYIKNLPHGRSVGVTVTQARNYKYHQKLICLLTYCFDVMPRKRVEYRGQMIEQEFETFRREFVAISGHYTVGVKMNGELRIEPQSISYAKCSEELAQKIYSDVINKALELLGTDQTRDDLDEIVNNILRFDS